MFCFVVGRFACGLITDVGVVQHVTRLPRLAALHLGQCYRITAAGRAAARQMPSLRDLHEA